MSMLDCILEQVQKTNKDMTREKLIEELQKSRYSAICLALVCGNEKSEKPVILQAFIMYKNIKKFLTNPMDYYIMRL